MTDFVSYDGQFYAADAPLFTAKERALLYGDGVFTSIKVCEGRVEHCEAHLERLKRHAQALGISYAPIHIHTILNFIVKQRAQQGTWRLKIMITGGTSSDLSLSPRIGKVLMTLRPYVEPLASSVHLGIFPEPIIRPFARLKTMSYIDRLAIKHMAKNAGYDEMLVLSPQQELLEVSCGNIFWVHGEKFCTPCPRLPLLHGIALQCLEKCAQALGFTVEHHKYTLKDISADAHLFICNALICVQPVASLAQKNYPLNPAIENSLRRHYQKELQHSAPIVK